jgi:hypothetical protein
MEKFETVNVKQTLTPALSHPMGEGESHSVSLKVVSVGFAGSVLVGRVTPRAPRFDTKDGAHGVTRPTTRSSST